jgi:DnaJ domain
MKLTSKYFDSIRVKPSGGAAAAPQRDDHPTCQFKGCTKPGPHKAPMGRGRDGEFFNFCAPHVREYNASYNYFDGMTDDEVADFQKDAAHGHRPTWKTGTNADMPGAKDGVRSADSQKFAEARAQRAQNFYAWRAQKAREDAIEPKRRIKPLQQKSLDVLGLPDTATKAEVKTRYKDLVKTHHPDVNGGDRSSEDKLREIIQAYNLLKQAGLG